MKKSIHPTLYAIALAAAATGAQAQNVRIYGLLDAGLASSSVSGGASNTTTDKTEFVTGGLAPNFVGIDGAKDLGKGIKGGFKLEQGFLLNAPADSSKTSRFAFGDDALFNRHANVYLDGSYGRLTVGTQSNIAFKSVLMTDPRYAPNFGSSLAAVIISGGLSTADNGAVTYTSPNWSGFTAAASYVPETSTIRGGSRLSGTYVGGPLRATLAYYTTDVIGETENRKGIVAGGAYKWNQVDMKLLYARQATSSYDALTTVGMGGSYLASDDLTFDLGFYRSSDERADYKMDTAALGIQYQLLKDVKAYAQYANVKNNGSTLTPFNFAPSTLIGTMITAGQTANTFNVGLLYQFF